MMDVLTSASACVNCPRETLIEEHIKSVCNKINSAYSVHTCWTGKVALVAKKIKVSKVTPGKFCTRPDKSP